MTIRPAAYQDIPLIHQLANEIWWHTYKGVISDEQISFMLLNMYSEEALTRQFGEIDFLISEREGIPVGFAGFSFTEPENLVYKLHKIYVLPSEQGKGTGKSLILYVENLVKSLGGLVFELNVNRGNKALGFYKKLGFEIYQTVDIPYYGFELNDYVMRKVLESPSSPALLPEGEG